jgi:DNA replicative helicase MCM subunit Mcm2 (Cdc46/Mcm family)
VIPKAIVDFINKTVDGSHSLATDPLEEINANVLPIINTLVSGADTEGIGVCIKREIKGVSTKDSGKDRTLIDFAISDGENTVNCVAHNCNDKYLPGKMTNSELEAADEIIRHSISEGFRVKVTGCYANFNRKRVFILDEIEKEEDSQKSQLEEKQVKAFLDLCKKEKTTPLELMMADETLWGEIYTDDEIKLAILLFCLSPMEKEDMIHIGFVTNPGEGKNHLVDRVISPFVKCRMAGTGKLSTFAGLFGAMSGDDLGSIELGLLSKMNHERLVFSEFQTLDEDVYGELLNLMSDGKFSLQKGKMDIDRNATLNIAFFGNPPSYWNEEEHDRREMLAAFGKYTFQIISRLTLIFAKPTLNSDPDAPKKIKRKIMQNMDREFSQGNKGEQIDRYRLFFREYMKFVSRTMPKLGNLRAIIESAFKVVEDMEEFKDAFAMRGPTDYRKWAEFNNLIRGFARLNGRNEVNEHDVMNAMDLFQKSLQTLTQTFPIKALNIGVDVKQIELHKSILDEFNDGAGHGRITEKEIKAYTKRRKLESEWDALKKIKLADGSKLVEEMPDFFYVKNVNWEDFSEDEGGESNE